MERRSAQGDVRRAGGRPRRGPASVAVVVLALSGCATTAPPRPDKPECPVVGGDVADRERPWTFAVLEGTPGWTRIDLPTSDSEDVLFAHFYEGLTRLDCRGQVLPALAASWADSADGRVWTFELRDGARFENGAPVDAAAVDRSWARARRRSDRTGPGAWEGLALRDPEPGSRTVRVVLETPDPDLPRRVSRPEFRIRDDEGRNTRDRHGRWESGERGEVIASVPGETVRFRYARERDVRDAFTADVDAVVTRDRDALRYLAERPDVRLTPLPWSRRYVLVDPHGRLDVLCAGGSALGAELARDVVRSVARAVPPSRDESGHEKESADGRDPGGPPGAGEPPRTLRYPRDDADAKRIAERLASLASRGGEEWTVEAAGRDELLSPTTAAVRVVRPWRADSPFSPLASYGANACPLVETRAFLVTRDPLAGLRVDGYGVPLLDDAGFAEVEDGR